MKSERMLAALLVLLLVFLVGIFFQSSQVSAQAGLESNQPEWVMQTRVYPAGKGRTWDAYLYNVRTGEAYFINQSTKTLVKEGIAKGADK